MKIKHYLALITVVFILLFFVFLKTMYVKYVLLGIGFLFGGIVFRIDDIDHPTSSHTKRMYPNGVVAWIAWILIVLYLIFYCSYLIKTTGNW
jgi:hypothetical protein